MNMIKFNRHTYWPSWIVGDSHPLWVHNSDIVGFEVRTFYTRLWLRGGHTAKVTDYTSSILNTLHATVQVS